jgi:hypothetical protein
MSATAKIVRLLLGLVLVAAALPTAAMAAAPGVVSDVSWGISRADVDREVALMQRSGVKWARVNANWGTLEHKGKGLMNAGAFADLDYAVSRLRGAGIQVLMPISDGVPYWASADPLKVEGRWNRRYRPARYSDYADFVRYIAARYRPVGVNAYEVWNEPNTARMWPSGVSAADYAQMLKAAYPAIKQVHPGATVVTGGVNKNDYDFVEALYQAGVRPYFDAVAVHPYASGDPTRCWTDPTGRRAKNAMCAVAEVRSVMVANGDAAKPVWATEWGWSSSIAQYGVTNAQQADYVRKGLSEFDRYPYVTHHFYYAMRNAFWSADDPASLEGNYGLVRTDFTAKPALDAFRTQVAGDSSAQPPTPASATSGASGAPTSTRTMRLRSRTVTTLSARRAGRAVAALVARVRGADAGQVAILLRRRGSRRWRKADAGSGIVATSTRRLAPGRWRARAVYRGSTTDAGSRSRLFTFRVR